MPPKKLLRRAVATADIAGAADYYNEKIGNAQAIKFVDAVEQAMQNIQHNPSAGSPRYSEILDWPDLRSWLVHGYPYIVFYLELELHIEVLRILHTSRELPGLLVESDAEL